MIKDSLTTHFSVNSVDHQGEEFPIFSGNEIGPSRYAGYAAVGVGGLS